MPAPTSHPGSQSIPSAAAPDDTGLVARMAARDEVALAALYDAWAQPVYALIVHIVREHDIAEDLVEATFWQAWESASTFDAARDQVGVWLLAIARRQGIDAIQRRHARRGDSLVDRANTVSSLPVFETEDPALDVIQRTRAQHALRTLTDDQRRALELSYFGGLTRDDIAEYLGQSVNVVSMRLRAALQQLHTALGPVNRGVQS